MGRPAALPQLTLAYSLLILPLPIFLLIWRALHIAEANRENQGAALRAAWRQWRDGHGSSCAARVALLPLFMAGFTSFKFLISSFQPFAVWDERLARLDQALHGMDPWMLLEPFYSLHFLTFTINVLYYPVWFFVSLGSWIVVATGSHPRRQQFLITFLLLWIVLGTVGGALMSSAGPILYDRSTGDPARFAGLLQHLTAANDSFPLIALIARDRLWEAHVTGMIDVGTGISAMPSLHVAIVTLCALFAWQCGRKLGWAMTAYAAVIFLASVHLGWHYAVDGYVSILATLAIWHAVGYALRRSGRSAGQRASNPSRNATRLRPSSGVG
jgi:hypothetical protein